MGWVHVWMDYLMKSISKARDFVKESPCLRRKNLLLQQHWLKIDLSCETLMRGYDDSARITTGENGESIRLELHVATCIDGGFSRWMRSNELLYPNGYGTLPTDVLQNEGVYCSHVKVVFCIRNGSRLA